MTHSFTKELAREFGQEEAVVLYAFQWWLGKARQDGADIYDDRAWCYRSVEELQEVFDYWSVHKVRRVVESLVEQGVLMKGNWAREAGMHPFDRRVWYAFTDEARFLGAPRNPVAGSQSASCGTAE